MRIIFLRFMALCLVFSASMHAQLDHVCAYTNQSVVKFREKTVQLCLTDSLVRSSKIKFGWPVDLCEFWVSSLFGPRRHQGVTKQHGGVDMAAPKGTQVKASAAGVVMLVTLEAPGYGTLIEIMHKNGFITRYGHLDTITVDKGDRVYTGDVIGTVGATGNVRGKKDPSHLHFEILFQGKRVNPLPFLYCSER